MVVFSCEFLLVLFQCKTRLDVSFRNRPAPKRLLRTWEQKGTKKAHCLSKSQSFASLFPYGPGTRKKRGMDKIKDGGIHGHTEALFVDFLGSN